MNVDRPQRRLLIAFHLLCWFLLGLSIFIRFLPSTLEAIPPADSWEARWWGLWPITYLPAFVYWPAIALVVVALVTAQWLALIHSNLAEMPLRSASHRSPFTLLLLCAAALLVSFYLFPIVHTRWGDAYILSRSIAWPDAALRLTHSWQAPLDVRMHSIVWRLIGSRAGWTDAIPVYRWLSPVAGAVYLSTALAFARSNRQTPPWLSFGLLASLGLLQLFYGYVENYSFAAAGILLYLYFGLQSLQNRRPLWQAALALAITNALHPSTIVLTPSLLVCTWYHAARCRNNYRRFLVINVAAPFALVAASTVGMMELGGHGLTALLTSDRPGGSDARWFVPLFAATTQWERYTLISSWHLRDIINLQLLVAPFTLPALTICAVYMVIKKKQPVTMTVAGESHRSHESLWFLLTAAVAYLLFVWTWNPDYGGQRDWDLFSLSALPSTMLLAVLLPRIIPAQRRLVLAIGPLLLFQILHTAAWIYQNTLPWEWP